MDVKLVTTDYEVLNWKSMENNLFLKLNHFEDS